MNIQQIINESDIMVPNAFDVSDKISWLNSINQDFFNVVKIPFVEMFSTTNSGNYRLGGDVRAKNIDMVQVGLVKYRSLLDENVQPGENYWNFNDDTHTLTLYPVPYKVSLQGKVRYHKIATSTFTTSNLNAEPDAPLEYHWAYVLGLCSKLAKASEDMAKANNYENDYREFLNVAAANYMGDNDAQR